MGAVCCKREVNNDILLSGEDRLITNYRGKSPNYISETKEDSSNVTLPLKTFAQGQQNSFTFGKDQTRKKSNPRGRDPRGKKPCKTTYGRRVPVVQKKAYSGTSNCTASGMTAGHKYRKNNLQLAVVCPYTEIEENLDSEGSEGEDFPNRAFKCKVTAPQQNEPVKFANAKYNYVKARYMDSFHGTENKGSVLVNYTTSIPSTFSKENIAADSQKGKLAGKNSHNGSPKREGRDINIIMNKNKAGYTTKTKHLKQISARDHRTEHLEYGRQVAVLNRMKSNTSQENTYLAQNLGLNATDSTGNVDSAAFAAELVKPLEPPQSPEKLVLKLSDLLYKAEKEKMVDLP